MADLDLDVIASRPGDGAIFLANWERDALVAEVRRLRDENAALAAVLEDIAGMLDWNRLEAGAPPDWRATGECLAPWPKRCHARWPDDPVEWCPVCVAEVAWCAWKMGVLGA